MTDILERLKEFNSKYDYAIVAEAAAEIERLRAGRFTPAELQNVCHECAKEYTPFCDGCDAEQRKLFGDCRTDVLSRSLAAQDRELDRLRSRVGELEENAARWQWVLKNVLHVAYLDGRTKAWWLELFSNDNFTAAVDAARKGE